MGALVLLLLAIMFAVQLPAVQTALARFAAKKLSAGMDGRVEIGSVRLHPFNAVTVKDIVILDDHPAPDLYGRGCGTIDTLASVGSLSATLSPTALLRRKYLRLDRVDANDVTFNFVIEPDNQKGGSNLTRIFHLYGKDGSSTMPLDTLFSIGRAKFTRARYRMINMKEDPHTPPHGINYEDMDLKFNLAGHDVSMYGGRMHAIVDHLDAVEKCGYNILNASGSCAVGMGHTNIRNLRLKDSAGSNLRLPRFDLNYEGDPKAWSDFLKKVEFDATIAKGSHLVFHSIGNFSGNTFYGSPLALDITSCHFKGPVSNFRVTDLVFTGTDCGVSGTINGTMSGIPRPKDMKVDADITDLQFTTEGLTRLLADVGAKADLKSIAPHTEFTANGHVSGYLNDVKADLRLTSPLGGMDLNASALNIVDSSRPIEFKAVADGDRLNLGKILGVKDLGRSEFTAHLSGTLGSTPHINVDNLTVPSIELLGYEYHDLELEGYMIGSNAIAAFRSSDPNATFDLAANVDWKSKTAHIEAEITEFDLAATGIDKRGGKSLVSCSISGEQGFREEEPARVYVTGLQLTSDEGTYDLGDIEAQARKNQDEITLVLNSDMFDAKYKGTSDFAALVASLRSNTVDNTIPAFFNPEGKEAANPISTNTSLSATFHNTDGLLAFLLPGLKIGKGTALNIDAGTDGTILGYITAPQVEWKGISAKALDVAMGNLGGSLDGTIDADRLDLGNFGLDKASFSLSASEDLLGIAATYQNADLLEGGGELFMNAAFSRMPNDSLLIDVTTLPSQFDIKSNTWEMGQSHISLESGHISTDGLALVSGDQSIYLQGGIRADRADTLQVSFNELDLDIVNAFTGNKLGLKGILQGDATLESPFSKELALSSGLDLTGLQISGVDAGDISITSEWDDLEKAIAFNLSNLTDGIEGLDITGKYGMRDGSIDATAVFDHFNIDVAAPFVKSILPELGGTLTGTLTAGGNTKDIQLASESIQLDGVRFRVGYTNVAYTLDGTLGIADNIVTFNNIGAKDDFGGIGVLTGSLALRDLSAPVLDASLQMSRLKALNIPMGESGIGIYGDLAVSGRGRVSGPFSDLGVTAYISTAGAGTVNVPISSSMAASGSDLLTFVAPETDEDNVPEEPVRTRKGKLTVHARATLSPEVIANIEIDKDSGHVLTAGGSGTVVFDYNTAKDQMQLKGDYLIDKGKYLLNIPGIVSKEFDIKEGSALKFNGDVMESTLDIKATHNVKTTLGTLLADSTAVSTRRTVVCGLNISGKFRSPEVSFTIDVPDLDPSTKMQVDAALSTTDKVQKQFVALLLFGTFIPEENAGVVNGSNMIYANVGEIVAGQLNNILQKLDIPVDFGFGYQQDNAGTDMFDVAVSTQLFNNRLVVGGSLGNRKYSTSKSANGDIVGDLDIELKLDRSGELRFKLFSHSADEYTSSLDYSQRNGLGLSYQKEFDRFKTFIKDLFTPKKRKQTQTVTRRNVKRIPIE